MATPKHKEVRRAPAAPASPGAPKPGAKAVAVEAAATGDVLGDQLESLLVEFAGLHQELMTHVTAHREAIRKADGHGVQLAAEAQGRVMGQIGHREQRRRELVAAACVRFASLAGRRSVDLTLTDVAACMPEPRRTRLIRMARDLKSLVSSVHEQTSTIKAATVSLVAHMEGLMRHVGRQLSHAGTYSSRGFVEPGGMVVSALDLST